MTETGIVSRGYVRRWFMGRLFVGRGILRPVQVRIRLIAWDVLIVLFIRTGVRVLWCRHNLPSHELKPIVATYQCKLTLQPELLTHGDAPFHAEFALRVYDIEVRTRGEGVGWTRHRFDGDGAAAKLRVEFVSGAQLPGPEVLIHSDGDRPVVGSSQPHARPPVVSALRGAEATRGSPCRGRRMLLQACDRRGYTIRCRNAGSPGG